MRRGLAAALAGGWLAAAGCASPARIAPAELPDAPLLVSYLEPEHARRRVELLRELGRDRPRVPGIMQLEDLPLLLGKLPRSSRDLESLVGRVALVDPREGRAQVIAEAVPGAQPQARSADGRRLLLAAPGRGAAGYQLYVLDRETQVVRPLTRGPRSHPMGCFLGERGYAVVEVGYEAPGSRIVLTDPGGETARPLTQGPRDAGPACAPDGRTLAYVTRPAGGRTGIAVIDLAGDGAPRIVARGRDPVFTPDGAWIVYSTKTSRGLRIWRMRPDGSGKIALGGGLVDELRPAVSPDGRFVAYLGLEEERLRLRVRRFDGSGDRLLLEDGDALQAVW